LGKNGTGLMELLEKYQSKFAEFETALNGQKSSAIHTLRKQAFSKFEQLQIPTSKNEAWKYTNLNPLFGKGFEPVFQSIATTSLAIHTFPFIKANRLVFIDGNYSEQYSHVIDRHIAISSFQEELKNNNPLIQQYFTKAAGFENESLTALNTSFASDGAFVHVPKYTVLEHPVLLIYVSSGNQQNGIAQPRNLFIAESNSQVAIIESYQNPNGKQTFSNKVSEIFVHENAHVDFYKLMMNEVNYHHIGTTAVQLEKNSRFNAFTMNFGGELVRNNLSVKMNGQYAEANLNGVYVLNGKNHVDNHLELDHAMPNCNSNQLYKGLMDDQSTGVFNGKILVRQDAQKTNAFQSNKNILLSEEATINTKPQLEIFADDVKCSHGATIGQMDKNALFYLKSRGLDDATAKQIMFQAFVGEVIERVKIESLKTYLLEKLHDKFEE
jgi:Fe-S cluster assembly protein SufD